MRPIVWLFIAELGFFFVGLFNIIHGIIFILDPTKISYVVIACMFVVVFLDGYITYIFQKFEVTKDDLLRKY